MSYPAIPKRSIGKALILEIVFPLKPPVFRQVSRPATSAGYASRLLVPAARHMVPTPMGLSLLAAFEELDPQSSGSTMIWG